MNGKLVILAVGVGVGFLLGSRAGRGPYEKVAAATSRIWHDPRVQEQVDRTVRFANDKLEDVAGIVTDGTRNLVHRATAPKARPTAAKAKPAASKSKRGSAASSAE